MKEVESHSTLSDPSDWGHKSLRSIRFNVKEPNCAQHFPLQFQLNNLKSGKNIFVKIIKIKDGMNRLLSLTSYWNSPAALQAGSLFKVYGRGVFKITLFPIKCYHHTSFQTAGPLYAFVPLIHVMLTLTSPLTVSLSPPRLTRWKNKAPDGMWTCSLPDLPEAFL